MAKIVSSIAFMDLKNVIVTDYGTKIWAYDYSPLTQLELDGQTFVVHFASGDSWFEIKETEEEK